MIINELDFSINSQLDTTDKYEIISSFKFNDNFKKVHMEDKILYVGNVDKKDFNRIKLLNSAKIVVKITESLPANWWYYTCFNHSYNIMAEFSVNMPDNKMYKQEIRIDEYSARVCYWEDRFTFSYKTTCKDLEPNILFDSQKCFNKKTYATYNDSRGHKAEYSFNFNDAAVIGKYLSLIKKLDFPAEAKNMLVDLIRTLGEMQKEES